MTYYNDCLPAHPTSQSVGFWSLFNLWNSRQSLGQLDDRALDDIGITRAAAAAEAARPVWDVPQGWRR